MLKATRNMMLRYLKKKSHRKSSKANSKTNKTLKISKIIGSICTKVIPGTNFCDTGDNRRENNVSNSATHVISANVCNVTTVIN